MSSGSRDSFLEKTPRDREQLEMEMRSALTGVTPIITPEVSDIDRMDVDELEELFKSLDFSGKIYTRDHYEQLAAGLQETIQPKVSGTVSKEELIVLAKNLRKAFDGYLETHLIDFDPAEKKLQQIRSVCEMAMNRQRVLFRQGLAKDPDIPDDEDQDVIWGEELHELNIYLNDFHEIFRLKQVWLQAHLLQLVQNQDETLKTWFWKEEMAEFRSHIKIAQSTRPEVTVDHSTPSTALSRVPLEVMEMVFGFADLESCVALRQVNKDWYDAFKVSDWLMEHKMKERNLWIKPGDPDLQTWADCVLVFTARLHGGKWKTFNDVEKDLEKLQGRKAAENKVIVGLVLSLDEVLPASFSGMLEKQDEVDVDIGRLGDATHVVNPWTKATRKTYTAYHVIRSDEQGTVMKYEDLEVTLDPSVDPDNVLQRQRYRGKSIHLGDYFMFVQTIGSTGFVYPRDKPHYKHALEIDSDCHAISEAGDVIFLGIPGEIRLVDMESKQTFLFCKSDRLYGFEAHPVASYNGLLWWAKDDVLFPTFVDLQNPGVAYYREDRGIFIDYSSLEGFTQGSKSRGLGQFVFTKLPETTLMVDLASGICTSLEDANSWNNINDCNFFPGFQDGVFQLRHYNPDVSRDVRNLVLRAVGIDPHEEPDYFEVQDWLQ